MCHSSWILILILSIIIAPSLQAGSQTLLRYTDNNNRSGDQKVYGVELTATDFDGALNATPATYAIVEFYAHWFPACRNYKPHFEKVARLFNGPDAVHPGIVLMTRVDCALKINRGLCDKFSVSHFPMLFWGPSTKFSSRWKRNEASEIRIVDDGRTAERLLNWINNQTESSYGLNDENEHLPSEISDPGQAKKETLDKVCEITRKQLAKENNKPVTRESKSVDLGVEIVKGLAEEFGITVEEENAQTAMTTFQDAAYLIQNLCSERSA